MQHFWKRKYETLLARSPCWSTRITVDIQSIPTQENREADAISKMINSDDYKSTQAVFRYLNVIWGPRTIDRFALTKIIT